MNRHYSGPAEALLAVVEHHELAGRGTGLRRVESDLHAVRADGGLADGDGPPE